MFVETLTVLRTAHLVHSLRFHKPKMETPVPAADIIRRKIEDHVAKKDLRAAVVQCEELEILVGPLKQGRCKRDFLVARILERTASTIRYIRYAHKLVLVVAPVNQ